MMSNVGLLAIRPASVIMRVVDLPHCWKWSLTSFLRLCISIRRLLWPDELGLMKHIQDLSVSSRLEAPARLVKRLTERSDGWRY